MWCSPCRRQQPPAYTHGDPHTCADGDRDDLAGRRFGVDPPDRPQRRRAQAALGKRVFLGHQSIGAQVLKGVTEYARDAGLPTPSCPDPESGSLPTSGRYLAQSYVAENGEPLDKIAESTASSALVWRTVSTSPS